MFKKGTTIHILSIKSFAHCLKYTEKTLAQQQTCSQRCSALTVSVQGSGLVSNLL